ncbi:MAG: MFS transporter [Pseudomonadota bacterium]
MSNQLARVGCVASGTAIGLISNGLSFFLLIYYSQVVGLDPALAGLALMISLVFDAVSDPLVGRWSDRLQHRLGRRHPFLYLAAAPAAMAYSFIWVVPDLGQTGQFVYLLVMAVTLRLLVTLHVVPFSALLPEIARDYDQRTDLQNHWYASSWFMGTIMAVVMYAVFLADGEGAAVGSGVLRAEGYIQAGWTAGIVVLVCMFGAAIATRKYVPLLARPEPRVKTLRQAVHESLSTFSDRNFAAIAGSGIASSAAAGTSTALWAYLQPYFWGFNSDQTSMMLAAQLLSAVAAYFATPYLTSGREKRSVLIHLSVWSLIVAAGPIYLTLPGLFPTAGDVLFSVMLVVGVVQVTLIVMSQTLFASMIADIVESRELQTGRREEGLLVSVQSFIGKAATGLGIWIGGVLLAIASFAPDGDHAVSTAAVQTLGWVYAPSLTVLYVLSIAALYFYSLDRATHNQNLVQLKESYGQ